MKLWFISDTHNEHEGLQIPTDIDLVIHCGDESTAGDCEANAVEARRFLEWYAALEIPAKVLVPGNHSTSIEQGLIRPASFPRITFLIHEPMHWRGLKLFGSPFTPKFFEWAYMKPRSQLEAVWRTIPQDTDILITHGPPKGIMDVTRDIGSRQPLHVGSQSLTEQVETRIKPQIHAFGHIHDEPDIDNHGTLTRHGTQFINCACCDVFGRLKNHGVVVDIHPSD